LNYFGLNCPTNSLLKNSRTVKYFALASTAGHTDKYGHHSVKCHTLYHSKF